MQATMPPTTETRPLTKDTTILITDASLEALRLADALDGPSLDAQRTADGPDVPSMTADTPEANAFMPDTPEKADWVLKQIARHRSDAARVRENMELMARESEREADRLEWQFGAALQAFARRETEGGRKKSVRLPNGVLGFRTKPAGVQIADTDAALAWARQNLPAAVVETVDRKALTSALLETGEVVDFAAFTPTEEVFYIR